MEIVNPVDPDDLVGWSSTLRTTFLQEPDPAKDDKSAARWGARLEPERMWGARDRGRWVATLATEARRLTVPGEHGATRDVGVDALTAVTVNATHRRRGLLSTMIGASLAAAKERGDCLSYLIAAEWPIYGRYGYAPATQEASYTYRTRARGSSIDATDGAVRQVDPADAATHAPAVFERARGERSGQVDRTAAYWRFTFGTESVDGPANLYLHESADGPDGLLMWQPTRDFELGTGHGAIKVVDLVAASPQAYRNLWAYLSGIDVVEEVVLEARPVDEPVRWLLPDGRTLQCTYTGDITWLCLLDVPAALAARGYDVAGSLVVEVIDPSIHGYAAGRWTLDAGPEGASCTASTCSPDVTLSAHALASAYLGGYRLAGRTLLNDVEEHTTGSVRLLDALLNTPLAPWCQSGF